MIDDSVARACLLKSDVEREVGDERRPVKARSGDVGDDGNVHSRRHIENRCLRIVRLLAPRRDPADDVVRQIGHRQDVVRAGDTVVLEPFQKVGSEHPVPEDGILVRQLLGRAGRQHGADRTAESGRHHVARHRPCLRLIRPCRSPSHPALPAAVARVEEERHGTASEFRDPGAELVVRDVRRRVEQNRILRKDALIHAVAVRFVALAVDDRRPVPCKVDERKVRRSHVFVQPGKPRCDAVSRRLVLHEQEDVRPREPALRLQRQGQLPGVRRGVLEVGDARVRIL